MKTLEIFITGRVQKVGFRACIRKIASDMNVVGTVVNLPDGRVHIFATGEPIILEKFISMIYGCPRAVIRDIRVHESSFKPFNDFSIIKGERNFSI